VFCALCTNVPLAVAGASYACAGVTHILSNPLSVQANQAMSLVYQALDHQYQVHSNRFTSYTKHSTVLLFLLFTNSQKRYSVENNNTMILLWWSLYIYKRYIVFIKVCRGTNFQNMNTAAYKLYFYCSEKYRKHWNIRFFTVKHKRKTVSQKN